MRYGTFSTTFYFNSKLSKNRSYPSGVVVLIGMKLVQFSNAVLVYSGSAFQEGLIMEQQRIYCSLLGLTCKLYCRYS